MQQTGDLALCSGGVIGGLRVFAAHDFSFYRAIANNYCHVIDGGSLRQREGVDSFDLV